MPRPRGSMAARLQSSRAPGLCRPVRGSQDALDCLTCHGSVTLAHGGARRLNEQTTMRTFGLLAWTITQH